MVLTLIMRDIAAEFKRARSGLIWCWGCIARYNDDHQASLLAMYMGTNTLVWPLYQNNTAGQTCTQISVDAGATFAASKTYYHEPTDRK